jgi:hypothetical protein
MTEFRRDNHYVPQSYLRRWADTESRVWAYRVLVSHPSVPLWKRASVGGVAYHRHLYTQMAVAGETDEIERWLDQDFESPAAAVIDKVAADGPLSADDWSCLARFLAAQDVRTPTRLIVFLRDWEKSLPDLLDSSLRRSLGRLEAAARAGERITHVDTPHAEYFPSKVTIESPPSGDGMAQIRVETVLGRGLWLFSLKRLLTTTLNALLAHSWTILHARPGQNWLTSDTPVTRLNFFSPQAYDFAGGWGSPGTEIFLPLTPVHLLYTRIGEKPPRRGTTVEPAVAYWVQRSTIENAHRLVFGKTADPLVQQLRPRRVDAAEFRAEAEEWRTWHEKQSAAESDLRS